MEANTWEQTTASSTGAGCTMIITTGTGTCQGGHMWTFSGTATVSEGTLCDCGTVKYERPKYCDKCGHNL